MKQIIHTQTNESPNQDVFPPGDQLVTMSAYDLQTLLLAIYKASEIMGKSAIVTNALADIVIELKKEPTQEIKNLDNEVCSDLARFAFMMIELQREMPQFLGPEAIKIIEPAHLAKETSQTLN